MTAPSLAPFIIARPWLKSLVMPLANWYGNAAGYRKMGLRADDLISEENANVMLALRRLPAKESYDRIYRLRRATQLSVQHKLLPKSEWTKPEEDLPYLGPLLAEIEAEQKEIEQLDTLSVLKKH
ncbi:cytochrome b-c1 complex subunit 7 [Podospora aff. communis PSN243]|uniref:Cytochrome b-c1 complex subunit 7 n=1 Tax=Podospora aff. communis PSN243 TaxID=3040156 RepID=A0AAV9GIC3_9PEZI|nr:cytochrome b-c1 complex subunit 7 [Podospora aff. communis PSN243]